MLAEDAGDMFLRNARWLSLDYISFSQPPGRGPVPGPDINFTGPSLYSKKNLPGRGLTKVENHWTTRRYIPEDRNLHNHRCKNLNFYNVYKNIKKVKLFLQQSVEAQKFVRRRGSDIF
jgi:hypothetical protein